MLKEVPNLGNVDKQYALAFDFDGETASEPVLEAWDDDTYQSCSLSFSLGGNGLALDNGGVESPNDSWYKGICTTSGSPGADWEGTPLGGSGLSNVVYLNDGNGALSSATTLYANLKVVIPANPDRSGAETPVLCVKWTSN